MIVGATGSRGLQTMPMDVRASVLDQVAAKLVELGALRVLVGGAEGWDACVAAAAFKAEIPYTVLLPHPTYIDHYWAKNSVTGVDRSQAARLMLERADAVTVLFDAVEVPDRHSGVMLHSNLVRNCLMLRQADLGLVFDPASQGTKHGVSELRRHGVSFEVFDVSSGWSRVEVARPAGEQVETADTPGDAASGATAEAGDVALGDVGFGDVDPGTIGEPTIEPVIEPAGEMCVASETDCDVGQLALFA